jgi:hypothetical protein
LREKAETIGNLLKKNEIFLKEVDQMNAKDESNERAIEGAKIKIQILEDKI